MYACTKMVYKLLPIPMIEADIFRFGKQLITDMTSAISDVVIKIRPPVL